MSLAFIAKTLNILLQVTKGLWKKYGDKRVKDTPITEVIHHLHVSLCCRSVSWYQKG